MRSSVPKKRESHLLSVETIKYDKITIQKERKVTGGRRRS